MANKPDATQVVRAPLPVRLRMSALERTSPARAAKLAERLWFTVPPAPSASRLQRFTPAGGEPFFLMSGPSELTGYAFGPADGPLALLVHGWGGYWQQLSAHIPTLVDAGYRVLAWDAPSHGRSTHGAEGFGSGSVLEMADAVAAVTRQHGTAPALVLAHSIGAMAAMRAARQTGPAAAYVFLAPEVRLEPAIDWFTTVIGMGPRTRQLFLARLHRRIQIDLDEFDLTRDVRGLASLPPLLAVHDADDPDTPAAETEALVGLWPGAELFTTRGLGHRQVIWNPAVVGRVAEFVTALGSAS